ncbi:MAG: Fic family protein [Candidatus Aegiribacteria sp.]|nr:Fic family protein [Candidatus Aegiribacteria sp.]
MKSASNELSNLYRGGKYLTQPQGYRVFIPESLPPDPPIRISGSLQEQLSKADRALGRLDGSILTLPNPDLFVFMYIRKEAVLSSQIEGTESSLQDVLAAEARLLNPGQPHDVGEVVNYVHAMNYGLERLDDLPVSTRLIREIHSILLDGMRGSHLTPGDIRTTQNWIGPRDCTLAEATFIPPPPIEIPRLLSEFERFLHSDTGLPLLVKIGLAHAQFETIHPFLDGNGRVGRLLIAFLLCEKKVLSKPVLYLSFFLKKHRDEYYDQLQRVRDVGTWEDWLSFFLKGVEEVSIQATNTARRIITLREKHRSLITDKFGRAAGNGHRVLEKLYTVPIVSVHEVQQLIGTSYPAANDLVTRLVKADILREITGQIRNRRFIYREYVDIFMGS